LSSFEEYFDMTNPMTIEPGTCVWSGVYASDRQTFILNNKRGLHTRPAALLARTLQFFNCRVQAQCGNEVTDATSLIGLLTLAAGYGSKITFTATGPESVRALDAVANYSIIISRTRTDHSQRELRKIRAQTLLCALIFIRGGAAT
jgi:phosphotransferase system HPr (HPr) family protein